MGLIGERSGVNSFADGEFAWGWTVRVWGLKVLLMGAELWRRVHTLPQIGHVRYTSDSDNSASFMVRQDWPPRGVLAPEAGEDGAFELEPSIVPED